MTEHESPLSPAARAGLVASAGGTILLFYVTALLSMVAFGALAFILLCVTIGAARFGLAAFVGRLLQVPVRLIGILGRKLWLPSETTYRVALTPEDAPGLFAISRALSQRSALVPPESISVEMHTNAWVQLRGYRRGAGRTSLGVGFDLLAGLTRSELAAGPAPERGPARPGQRGGRRGVEKRPAPLRPGEGGRSGRLQPGEAFTAWLVSELTGPGRGDGRESLRHAVDPYSTHPALRDRLAALPAEAASLRDTRPGIALLVDPDRVAGRLVAEIQRVIAVQERKDTRHLARETRKLCRAEGIGGPVALLGVGALLVGLVLGLIGATSGFPLDMMGTAVGALIAGVLLVRHSRYRDRRPLPVPTYGTLSSPRPPETQEQLAAAEEAIAAELRASAAVERTRRARCAMLVRTSYAALQERDYLRAHVAARLALELKKTSIEAGLAYAIAAAGLGNAQQAHSRLGVIRRKVGFRTLATKWGAAWALSLLDDWSCEGLLQQLHDLQPDVATYTCLLALAQTHRDKLHSAIGNAERGVALEPANRAAAFLLANLLLMVGRTAAAAARLDPLQDYVRTEVRTAFSMVRLRLMQRDTAGGARVGPR